MTTERFVGLLFLTGVLVFLIVIYYPESPKINNSLIKEEVSSIKENKMKDKGLKIIHCVPSGSANWFEFALNILENLKKSNAEIRCKDIKPISSKDYPQKANRPKNSVLANSKLSVLLASELENWSNEHERLYA